MVVVLVSTYNGEKYIAKQLESLIQQRDVDFKILIRDDGSKDNTLKLIVDIAQHDSRVSLIKGTNVGFIGSFTELVIYAKQKYTDAEYFAFCDQDDIWYPDKLKKSISALSLYDQNQPLLFSCNSDLINANDVKIGDYNSKPFNLTKENYLFNIDFQGCSMCFNRKALDIYAENPPKNVCHDKWMSMICNFFGVYIHSDEHLFGYRIHEGNAIGYKIKRSLLEKFIARYKYWFGCTNNINPYPEFWTSFNTLLDGENRKLIHNRINFRKSFSSKLWLLNKRECCPQPNLCAYIKYCIHLLLNKF